MNDRSKWTQLTDPNRVGPRDVALGDEEEITWKSNDGTTVGGVLVKPIGFQAGKKYPLIVAIHGGPAAADMLGFNGGYNAQVYAGAGYMVLEPNYRRRRTTARSSRSKRQGDYFTKGYQDIMTGVDYLIAQGLVDSTQMGVLGWSAGGHYSNWIETHTTRFKAISSGAGVANWMSMWARAIRSGFASGTSATRCTGSRAVSTNWWKQSPIATIKNAKTPMFIHVVDGDPRVPRPQSEEMHMALSKLGVPNEFWVYPGNDARHSRRSQPVRQGGRRDDVDGLLRARQRQEVRVARRDDVGGGGRAAARGRNADAATVAATCPRSRGLSWRTKTLVVCLGRSSRRY